MDRNRTQGNSPDRADIWKGETVSELSRGNEGQGRWADGVRVWVNGERVDPKAPSIAAIDHRPRNGTISNGVASAPPEPTPNNPAATRSSRPAKW